MVKIIALLLIPLVISACSLASSTESIPDEKSPLEVFLYDAESISFNRLASPGASVRLAIENLDLNRANINEIIYTTISYSNTNLPSINVLLTSRISNGSLIIYNHGHDGLPTNNQSWAVDFINRALQDGYSFLITSMPLVGLNAPDPAVEYYMIPKGDQGFTSIGKSLLQWPIIHQIYQAINGSGNFMHFFVDGSVLPAHFLGPNSKPRSYL